MAVLDDVARAYRAIHRSEPDRFEVDQAAARIEAGALTLDGYIDSQIARAETTTIPAFVFVARFGGNAPTSDYLDTVAAFAKAQYDYYVAIGSASPQLGPYEALGMAFSKTMEFNAKYGLSALADDNNFISLAYLEVFGRYVSGGAYANLKGQLDYFETLYKSAGFSASDATMQARGAVFGQLIGYQQTLPEERALVVTDEQARIFLKLAAHGASSIYGEPLENLPVAGRDIVGSSYDQDQYGWVNTIAPASSAAALRTTIYDDHVVVGVINASIGSRGLTGIDGGAGNDLIEVGGASGGSFIRGGKGNDEDRPIRFTLGFLFLLCRVSCVLTQAVARADKFATFGEASASLARPSILRISCAILPPFNTTTRSAIAMVSGRWAMMIRVSASFCTAEFTNFSLPTSSALVASSRKRIFGRL